MQTCCSKSTPQKNLTKSSGYIVQSGLKIILLATILRVAIGVAAADSPNLKQDSLNEAIAADFRNFLQLAIRNPESYGFKSAVEAEAAHLGRSYAYYSTSEWAAIVADDKLDIAAPPRRLYEVVNSADEPRCVYITLKNPTGDYKGVLLGFPNLQQEMRFLRLQHDNSETVLLVEPETRKIFFTDIKNPKIINSIKITQ
jgi:hypothetical protein